MKPRLYLETTIPSYFTAWPSRDLIRAAHQQSTREWWHNHRSDFDLFVSELVIRECQGGDPLAAAARLEVLEGIEVLNETADVVSLAEALITGIPFPKRAVADAFHLAIATVHGLDDLLTWNCTHIANALFRPRIEAICRVTDFDPPIICTPDEFLAEDDS